MTSEDRRILFICPITQKPIGGIKQIYKQVQVLNELNFNAYVLHQFNFNKMDWIEFDVPKIYSSEVFQNLMIGKKNKTKIDYFKSSLFGKLLREFMVIIGFKKNLTKDQTIISKQDIIVIPEIFVENWDNLYPENEFIIYIQECFLLLRNNPKTFRIREKILSPKMLGVLLNSEYGNSYLKYIFPDIQIFKIRHSIGFSKPGEIKKEKILLYTSRKLKSDSNQVVNIIKIRGKLADWKIIDMNKNGQVLSDEDFEDLMQKSAIFLSFSETEGFGLPPAEAMKCGCIVIGYTGYGGRDYFLEEFSYPIEERNILQFVKTIEEVALNYSNTDIKIKGLLASEYISQNYNDEIEKQDIIKCWEAILNNKKSIH